MRDIYMMLASLAQTWGLLIFFFGFLGVVAYAYWPSKAKKKAFPTPPTFRSKRIDAVSTAPESHDAHVERQDRPTTTATSGTASAS